MAIQFNCPGCSQPIEVDGIHAGQTAACPYCRRVVNVPTESSLEQVPLVSARPTTADDDTAAPPPPGELPVGLTMSPREHAARAVGTYALICAVLAVLLFGGFMAYSISLMAPEMWKHAGSQPSQEQLVELGGNPWLAAVQIGSMFFALVGVVLGVTSLVQSRRNNWRAIVSVVVCGLLLLCVCGGVMFAAARGLPAGA